MPCTILLHQRTRVAQLRARDCGSHFLALLGEASESLHAMSSLEVDSQQLLRADRAVKAEKGICLKVSQKTAIGITVGGIIVSFLIGLAIGFGCVASSHGVTSTPRPGLASGVRVARELCGR